MTSRAAEREKADHMIGKTKTKIKLHSLSLIHSLTGKRLSKHEDEILEKELSLYTTPKPNYSALIRAVKKFR